MQVGAHARGGESSDGRGVAVDSAPLVLDVSQSYALCGLQLWLVDESACSDVCMCVCVCLESVYLYVGIKADILAQSDCGPCRWSCSGSHLRSKATSRCE